MQCFHREIVIKGNMNENTDNFSLCQAKGHRAEHSLRRLALALVSVGLVPTSAALGSYVHLFSL